ncbi:MAG TPA: hypothetical protein VLM36_11315 [Sphingomicrobium sp.]|nr:hypothetical protein [Sphingomicrobium sp.]
MPDSRHPFVTAAGELAPHGSDGSKALGERGRNHRRRQNGGGQEGED